MKYLKNILDKIIKKLKFKFLTNKGSAAYWTINMVASGDFENAEHSLNYFLWRNQQYPGYIELMPVTNADNLVVLDYGCGPGNDLVGFSLFSNCARVIGADVSLTALKASKKRLALHSKTAELIQINEDNNKINLPDNSVDLVHSSGVLHHVKSLSLAIKEIHRILKPGGKMQVMVYNYESLWLHLYVAFLCQIEKEQYKQYDLMEAFKRLTDGPDCPISHCYRPNEFLKIVNDLGFYGHYKGSAISLFELQILPERFKAISSMKLKYEHRQFLSSIIFNANGYPTVNNKVAGVDACFEFTKI
jgi:ubiquinone/menaquinone biosynthesis C-methylase UbiE